MKFYQAKLANGLTILGEQRDNAVSVAVGFFVKTGARDETPELSGCSHFLEHMMFKGTAKRSALELTFDMGRIGAQANAFTSEENTVYYQAVLPEYFADAVEILSDQMRSVIDEQEFNTEKLVILEEIALYQDKPTYVLFERSMREFYEQHPAGNSVLGTDASVRAISREMMWEYFQRRYRPNNMVLVASGKFNWEEFLALAEKHCGSWERGETPRAKPKFIPTAREIKIERENLQGAHVCLMAPAPSATDEERAAARVLANILGDSTGSRVYWEITDKGLADSAGVDSDESDGVGYLYGYASTSPENVENVRTILREILATPLKFSDEDLSNAKTKLGTRIVLQGESSMRRLFAVGMNWQYRSEYTTLEQDLERIRRVDRAAVEKLIKRYPLSPLTSVTMVPA